MSLPIIMLLCLEGCEFKSQDHPWAPIESLSKVNFNFSDLKLDFISIVLIFDHKDFKMKNKGWSSARLNWATDKSLFYVEPCCTVCVCLRCFFQMSDSDLCENLLCVQPWYTTHFCIFPGYWSDILLGSIQHTPQIVKKPPCNHLFNVRPAFDLFLLGTTWNIMVENWMNRMEYTGWLGFSAGDRKVCEFKS